MNRIIYDMLDELLRYEDRIPHQSIIKIKEEVNKMETKDTISSTDEVDRKKKVICNFIDAYFKNSNKAEINKAMKLLNEIAKY